METHWKVDGLVWHLEQSPDNTTGVCQQLILTKQCTYSKDILYHRISMIYR